MLIKMIMSQGATDKDYKEVLKRRINLCYIVIVLGAITLGCSILFSTGEHAYLPDFLSGVYTGVGSALIAMGIVFSIKIRRILKDEKKIRQKKLSEQDERNQMIAQKAIQSSTIVILILAYMGVMVAGLFNLIVFWTLWTVVMVFTLVLVAFNIYYQKKF